MRAVLCTEFGPPESLQITELPDPVAGAGEVVIDVATASLNFPDLLTIRGLYQFKAEPPFVPGAEASGTVSAVGAGVTNLSVGQRVMAAGVVGALRRSGSSALRHAFPLTKPCRSMWQHLSLLPMARRTMRSSNARCSNREKRCWSLVLRAVSGRRQLR